MLIIYVNMNGLRYSTEGNYSTTTLSQAMCDVTSVHYSVDPIVGTYPKRFEQYDIFGILREGQ